MRIYCHMIYRRERKTWLQSITNSSVVFFHLGDYRLIDLANRIIFRSSSRRLSGRAFCPSYSPRNRFRGSSKGFDLLWGDGSQLLASKLVDRPVLFLASWKLMRYNSIIKYLASSTGHTCKHRIATDPLHWESPRSVIYRRWEAGSALKQMRHEEEVSGISLRGNRRFMRLKTL